MLRLIIILLRTLLNAGTHSLNKVIIVISLWLPIIQISHLIIISLHEILRLTQSSLIISILIIYGSLTYLLTIHIHRITILKP
jgi:hypothetical protein